MRVDKILHGAGELRLGLVALARTTFDVTLAAEVAGGVRGRLAAAGYALAGPAGLVTSLDEATQAAGLLAAAPLDLLVVLQATFADSSLVLHLAQSVDAPLLLWAVPEARTGGRLRLNSLCGLNLAAHALRRRGLFYDYVYCTPEAEAALARARCLALAGRARRRLRGARLGQVGAAPAGLDSCQADSAALARRLGVEVLPLPLDAVLDTARRAEPGQVQALLQELRGRLAGLDDLDAVAVGRTLGAYLALEQVARAAGRGLDGLAVRCWPEFFTELGGAACGALSLLTDEGLPCSCEADVNGTLSQLILHWLSGEPALGTDLVSVDAEADLAVVWHCGLAPLSMADPQTRPRATIHSNRRLPLLFEFPLKPGRVTLARLSEATGSHRLVVAGGEMQRAPLAFAGTSGVLRFDRPAGEVLDTLLAEGLEHHLALTYGDYVAELLALARMVGVPVLHLTGESREIGKLGSGEVGARRRDC